MEEQAPSDHPLPKVPDWTSQDKLSAEKEILGFYVSGHPLDQLDKASELATYRSGNLEGLAKGPRSRSAASSPASFASATKIKIAGSDAA